MNNGPQNIQSEGRLIEVGSKEGCGESESPEGARGVEEEAGGAMPQQYPVPQNTRFKDLTGVKLNRFTVLYYASPPNTKHKKWAVRCDCGEIRVVDGGSLRAGTSKSCGCHNREVAFKRMTKHGCSHGSDLMFKTYTSWVSMRSRCLNPNNKKFPRYGGRGITICERWDDFNLFLEDMSIKPSAHLSIDRIDNDGNYEPGNCRWATPKQQSRNRSATVYVSIPGGELLPLVDAAERFNISQYMLAKRIRRGVPQHKLLLPSGSL